MPPPSPISRLKPGPIGMNKLTPAAWLLLMLPPLIDAGPLKVATPPPSTSDQLLSISVSATFRPSPSW